MKSSTGDRSCSDRLLTVLVWGGLAAFIALVAGAALVLFAPETASSDGSSTPTVALVGGVLAALGLIVILPVLLVGIPLVAVRQLQQGEAHDATLLEQLVSTWRHAGRVQRLAVVVIIPLALFFLATRDTGVLWLLMGTVGGTMLIDDYLSPDGRLSPPGRRASWAFVLAAVVFFAGAWLIERDGAERWAVLLFLVTVVAIGLDRLLALRRSRS